MSVSRSSGWGSTTGPSSRSRARRSCWRPRRPARRSIHLGTAVTVLSSDDPVRVYERFATLDAISDGRAEVILGRGSFIESFPLFGYELRDYEVLFEEKLELFTRLLAEKPVTWQGTTRAPLTDADVFPKTEARTAGLDRRRRDAGVGGARGATRYWADARDHRRPVSTIPPLRGPLPPLAGLPSSGTSLPGRRALARTHRRHRPAGLGRGLRGVRGDEQHHRAGARMAPVQSHAVPARRRAGRRDLRRLAGDGRAQDRRHRARSRRLSAST